MCDSRCNCCPEKPCVRRNGANGQAVFPDNLRKGKCPRARKSRQADVGCRKARIKSEGSVFSLREFWCDRFARKARPFPLRKSSSNSNHNVATRDRSGLVSRMRRAWPASLRRAGLRPSIEANEITPSLKMSGRCDECLSRVRSRIRVGCPPSSSAQGDLRARFAARAGAPKRRPPAAAEAQRASSPA